MGIFSGLFGKQEDFKALVDQGAKIIDVRSPQEYRGGHVPGSVNIPLDRIGSEVERLKKSGKPVILCCASGNRSGSATSLLKQNGIEAYNGGGWASLRSKL